MYDFNKISEAKACTIYGPPKDSLWPVSEIMFQNLNNKVNF
jgi:hypothetical protein